MVSSNTGSRQKIINKSRDLFHRYGIGQTSVDTILKETGVSKSNFYYHFKSKNELAYQVLRSRMDEYVVSVLKPTLENNNLEPYERLVRFYQRVINYHKSVNCEYGCPFGNIVLELNDRNDEFRFALNNFFEIWRQKIKDCVEEGISKGQIRSEPDADALSEFLLSHLEGAILMAKAQGSIDPLKRGTEAVLNIIKK